MEFNYVAVNEQGQRVTGICQAQTKEHVAQQLSERKLQLVSCRWRWFSVIKIEHKPRLNKFFVLEFSRQMSVLLASGLSITQAFEIVQAEQKSKECRACLQNLLALVQQGQSVSFALQQVSSAFDNNYLEVIAVGEQAGALARAFEQNYYYLAALEKLTGQVKQACVYPALVLLVSILVISILLVKVIPGFESLFSSFAQPLPFATLQVIALSEFIQQHWGNILLALGIVIAGFSLSLKVQKVKRFTDKHKLRLPIIGLLLKFNLYANFALSCHNMLAAGLPLHQVLDKLKSGTRNLFFSAKINDIQQNVLTGTSFHQSCLATGLFPSLFIQLVKVGEESGSLDQRLKNLAEVYQQRLDSQVKAIVNLIEPAIMIIMGVLIGGLVLVMYLPIFEMSTFL